MSSFAAISADGRMLSVSQKIIAIGKVYMTSHGFFPVGKSDSPLKGGLGDTNHLEERRRKTCCNLVEKLQKDN